MISPNDVKSIQHTSVKAMKAAKVLSKSTGRTSLTRLAKDSILEFPVIVSSSISTDECIAMTKAIEKYYASIVATTFSLYSVDLSKNDSVAEFIKRFHNNSDIPTNIKAASSFVFESAQYENNPALQPSVADVLSCWNIITEQVDTSSLNDVYNPYAKTKSILADKIQKLAVANESFKEDVLGRDGVTNQVLQKIGTSSGMDDTRMAARTRETTFEKNKDGKMGESRRTDKQVNPNSFNAVVKNDKVTALEPTLVNVQFIVHGGDGDNKQFVQNVVLGIKAMVRMVRSDLMITNMSDASKNSNSIFKFIKWTKGEYKFVRDVIFNVSEIKDMAITDKADKNFLKALRRRKAINNFTQLFDNRVPPNTMVVMTSYEVMRVAEATGVDLNQIHNALNLLNKYYLIGFAIYDTETKILSTLFDGDVEFAQSSIDAIKSSTSRNSDTVTMSEAMKIFGRV